MVKSACPNLVPFINESLSKMIIIFWKMRSRKKLGDSSMTPMFIIGLLFLTAFIDLNESFTVK